MKLDEWTELLKEIVRKIGDRTYQERSWFGKGPEVSSPDEMMCRIFDDLDFNMFLESSGPTLADGQRRLGNALRQALEEFSAQTPERLDPAEIIDHPAWQTVRQRAKEFARVL